MHSRHMGSVKGGDSGPVESAVMTTSPRPPTPDPVPVGHRPVVPAPAPVPGRVLSSVLERPEHAPVLDVVIPVHNTSASTSSAATAPDRGIPTDLPWQLLSFAAIGVASTLAYGALFLLLRNGFGAQAANFLALLLTALGNTAANRRLTFGVSGRHGAARHQLQGLLVFGLGLALTSGGLALLHAASPVPSRGIELAVLVLANLVATVLRFLTMRVWIFRRHRQHSR